MSETKYDPQTRQYSIWHNCLDCNKGKWVRRVHGEPISYRCKSCAVKHSNRGRLGANHPLWKGGRAKRKDGYVLRYLAPDDFFYPMSRSKGRVLEHRLVVAQALGRNLHSWEIVHHKKGYARDDNRYPETLQLVTDDRHKQITILENQIARLEKHLAEQAQRITLLEAESVLLKEGLKIA